MVESKQVDFPANTSGNMVCTSFIVIDNEIALEPDKQFSLNFSMPLDSLGIHGSQNEACVTIVDDDSKSCVCVCVYIYTIHVFVSVCLLAFLSVCISSPVLTLEFVEKMFLVPEDNGTLTICLNTSIETAEELVVEVTAAVISSPGAASKRV